MYDYLMKLIVIGDSGRIPSNFRCWKIMHCSTTGLVKNKTKSRCDHWRIICSPHNISKPKNRKTANLGYSWPRKLQFNCKKLL